MLIPLFLCLQPPLANGYSPHRWLDKPHSSNCGLEAKCGSTVMQCHPILASSRCFSLSRSLFLRIFATQKSLLLFGILQHSLFSMFNVSCSMFRSALPLGLSKNVTPCPCQKQPFTKIQVRYFLSTISGLPGNRLWFNR